MPIIRAEWLGTVNSDRVLHGTSDVTSVCSQKLDMWEIDMFHCGKIGIVTYAVLPYGVR